MQPWLIILCPYFGRWPAWINFFIESCKWNPEVRWRLYTDCGKPENSADNVDVVHVSFDSYKKAVSRRLEIEFDPIDPYKLCDLKPAPLGFVHEKEISEFPFFGFGDLDVIYGGISRFYGEARLKGVDVASTHPERLSGHFAIFRNTIANRHAFENIPDYREKLKMQSTAGLDEGAFTRVFLKPGMINRLLRGTRRKTLFVESYSTVLSTRRWHDGTMNYPQRWFWKEGKLTNEKDGEREFLYLHFMRWQTNRWINTPPQPGEGAWLERNIVGMDWRGAANGFCISPAGFTPFGCGAANI